MNFNNNLRLRTLYIPVGWIVFLLILSVPMRSDAQAQSVQPLVQIHTVYDFTRVSWSPDGGLIAAGEPNGTTVFDTTLQEVTHLSGDGIASVAWNLQGTQLATGGGFNTKQGEVQIWQRDLTLNTFTLVTTFHNSHERVSYLTWSPNGTMLATASLDSRQGLEPIVFTIEIWNTVTWTLKTTLKHQYENGYNNLSWSPDSSRIAGAGTEYGCNATTCLPEKSGLYIADVQTGDRLFFLGEDYPSSLDWSKGNVIAVNRPALTLYNPDTGEVVREIGVATGRIKWHPDGMWLASIAGNDFINVQDGPTGEFGLAAYGEPKLRDMDWNPDGRRLVASSDNGTIQIWDTSFLVNTPPTANAGPDQTVVASNGVSAQVTLDGTGSSDSDGTITAYSWSDNGTEIATGSSPQVTLPLGSHTITLTITDNRGGTANDTVVVTVVTCTPVPIASIDGLSGNGTSSDPVISADGSYTAFVSSASNLVASDTNGVADIFIHDWFTCQTGLVSVSSAGAQSDGGSYLPALSADGRYVAFESDATNLVSGDTNAVRDVFARDRQTNQTTRVSVSSAGAQGNGESYRPTLSADGRYVAFQSNATNLVTGDSNATWDVFVYDRQTAQTSRVSISSASAQGNGASWWPTISADGNYVAFESLASNLVSGDTNATYDVFVRDRQTNQTTRVSLTSAAAQGNGASYLPAISSDGRYVAYYSLATNLVTGDTNAVDDVFVRDRQTGQTIRVSASSAGVQADGASVFHSPALSGDGRYVTFYSFATNLVSGDTNGVFDIFVHDRLTGQTNRVSVSSAGVQSNAASFGAALSANGQYVAFQSFATSLVGGDTNNIGHIIETSVSWPAVTPLAVGTHQQDDSNIHYIGDWVPQSSASYSGGSAIYSTNPEPRIFFTFDGDGVVLYRVKATTRGLMEVCIDGSCQQVDNYASVTAYQQPFVFNGLGSGVHSVMIRKLTGTYLDLDRVDVLAAANPLPVGAYEQTDTRIQYFGVWTTPTSTSASGGSYNQSSTLDATITFAFQGTGLTLYRQKATTRGLMEVCIDGSCQQVDNYSATTLWQQPATFSGLTSTLHTVRIRRLTGTYIDLDKVAVSNS